MQGYQWGVRHRTAFYCAAYTMYMTNISNPEFEAKIVRGQPQNAGQFAPKTHSAPEYSLTPQEQLDAANGEYQANTRRGFDVASEYLQRGMPANAEHVTFMFSDSGDYLCVKDAFDSAGNLIDREEDDEIFERWQQVDDALSWLGDPEEVNEARELVTQPNEKGWVWRRTQATDEEKADALNTEFRLLSESREELSDSSQAAAIAVLRENIPEGYSKVVLTWSDQGDFLSVDKLVRADGTEHTWDDVDEEVWEELEMAASDIRNVADAELTAMDDRGNFYALSL